MVVDVLRDGRGGVNAAGYTASTARRAAEGSAADCLTIRERPATPPEIRKWRRSQTAPGERLQHPGLRDDVKRLDPKAVYGVCKVKGSDHVPDVWKQPGAEGGLARLKLGMSEAVYRSSRDEALGKSKTRGHRIPGQDFKYGVTSTASEAVKGVLYPPPQPADEEVEAMYKRSHHSYGPGEQVKRGYDWPVDAKQTVFGRPGNGAKALNGASVNVAAALTAGAADGSEPARITSKKLHDFRQLQASLGRAHNLAQDGASRRAAADAAHVYGKPAQRRTAGDWDARACVEGDYTFKQQQPDADLGKSLTPGFRNVTTEDRAFGVPAIRTDIPAPAQRSVADAQNYGDGVPARYLVNPGQFSSLGVEDDEFFCARPKDELKELFAAVGTRYADDVFDAIFAEASGGGGGGASITELQRCAAGYDVALEKGREGVWQEARGL